MIGSYLRRGMATGLLAGLLAGLFAFLFGEQFIESAIQLEQAADNQGGEIFNRSIQKIGLFFTTGLFGVTIGELCGLVYACFRDHLLSDSEWNRSLSIRSHLCWSASFRFVVELPALLPGHSACLLDRLGGALRALLRASRPPQALGKLSCVWRTLPSCCPADGR
ncbi:MAG: CbtA family protein [Rubrobacter sp.]|nr:CbtA family protein [Rubrobacter sp.]